ncbi:MAG TPA: glucose 1-dehydrogenase [Gemmatimonadales bacterium]|nr:glucose 1-dehydrogenase [Gemmatimonadales bacterium]
MRAVLVTPKKPKSAHLGESPKPKPQGKECLVRVLEVGIDGTDRDIDQARYGEAPAGEKELILGHESLGEIVEGGSGLVVAMVRRPCPELCPPCKNTQSDFCTTGHFTERGIKGRHGYLAEFYAEVPEYLIPIPAELRDVAVLMEPLSVVEKAFRNAQRIQERLPWAPRRVLITGAGGIGTLAACLARLRGYETLVYSRGASTGAGDFIRSQLSVKYVSSDHQTLADVAREWGEPDLMIEATGASGLVWAGADVLALNGVLCMLSVTGGNKSTQVPADELNDRMVLGNRVVFGSVNAERQDFEQGVKDLLELKRRWPDAVGRLITRRLKLEQIRTALDDRPAGDLKTILLIS